MLDFSREIQYNYAMIFIEKKGEKIMQENNNQNPEIELDENHLIQIRKEKLSELQEQGKNVKETFVEKIKTMRGEKK